jgi:ribonuclease HIII
MAMNQGTKVFQVSSIQGIELRAKLDQANWEFRPLQYALFQARRDGVVVSCYESGKLVIQGKHLEGWELEFLPVGLEAKPASKKEEVEKTPSNKDESAQLPAVSLGSDEAGKGDTFGGLYVCAVSLTEENVELLRSAGVGDSKTIADRRIKTLAPWLKETVPFHQGSLSAATYNKEHAKHGSNVNRLLTQMHVDCLEALAKNTGQQNAVVDRFGANMPVTKEVKQRKLPLKIYEIPKAESHLAVAAASILARDAFLESMKEMGEHWAVDFPLGSGTPIPSAMKQFIKIHGVSAVGQVAKVHFRNVQTLIEDFKP